MPGVRQHFRLGIRKLRRGPCLPGVSQLEKSTVSWSRRPLLLCNKLDLHQVALPLICLLVLLNKLNGEVMTTSNVSLCMSYLPLVIFTSRILFAFLGTDRHSFHPLQFLNCLKNRNCILVSTLYGNGGHQVEKLSRHTNLPSTADVVMVVVVVQSFGADNQSFAGMYSIFIKWHSRLFAFLCF